MEKERSVKKTLMCVALSMAWLGASAQTASAKDPVVPAPLAAAEAQNGIFPDKVLIGRTAGLSGVSARQGQAVSVGMKAYFADVNAKGGVHGRLIEFIEIDDNYKADRAAENVKVLIGEKKVFAIMTSHGTGPTRGLVKIIDEAKVPMIGTTSGSVQRDPKGKPSRYFFNVRNSNYLDIKGITGFLKDIGDKKIAAIYQDDAFGKSAMADLDRAAQEDGVEIVAKIAMNPETNDPGEMVKRLMSQGGEKTQNVMTALVDKPTGVAIKALQAAKTGKRIFGISSSGEIEREIGIAGAENVVISQSTPPMRDTSHPGVAKFRAAMAKGYPDFVDSAVAFQGYLAAAVFVEGLKDAGRGVTRESLVDALEKFKNRQIEGMRFDYSTPLHEGLHYQELYMWGPSGRMIY